MLAHCLKQHLTEETWDQSCEAFQNLFLQKKLTSLACKSKQLTSYWASFNSFQSSCGTKRYKLDGSP